MGSFVEPPLRRIVLDGCEVDVTQCELVRGEEREHLTTKEVEVLTYLSLHPSRPISYEELLEKVWGHSRLASTQPVYSVIKRLRRKIDRGEHRHFVTVHGVGYRFEPPRLAPSAPRDIASTLRLSSFVGRAAELAAVERTLELGPCLVTLVGPGGAGKTRLGVELVERAELRGRDVVWVELGDLPAGAPVDESVRVALGVRGAGESGGLGRAARTRAAWAIVLDNAEHVLEPVVRAVADLAPVVRVLLTSRERLGVPGEQVVEVGPLPGDDAARLFAERARAAGRAVEPDARVAAIVERLDGLPLGIELAAAHASLVSIEQVERDLDRQIDRLSATRRGVSPRHTTLRASVEWSWELLSPRERTVLSACTVFSGGFTAEAAEDVLDGPDTRTVLLRLVERSLVRSQTPRGSPARYALYEAVRELALEHAGDRAVAEERHGRWAVERAHAAGALAVVPPPAAFAALAVEAPNLRAAFERSLGTDPARAASLALVLDWLAAPVRGPGGAPELRQALAVAPKSAAISLRLRIGRAEEGVGAGFLEETVALARAFGTEVELLEAERLVAAHLLARGEPGPACAPLEALLARAETLPDGILVLGRIALDLSEVHLASGVVSRARALAQLAERTFEVAGAPVEAARAASALAHVHREEGEPERSLSAIERARRRLEDAGDEVALARLALDRGVILAHLGRSDEAAQALEASIAAHHRLGLLAGELRARDWMVLALLGLFRDEEALAQAREMQLLAHELGRPGHEADRALASTWLVTGRLADADLAFGRALTMLEAGGKSTVRGHVLSARALGRILSGRLADAESDLVACAAIHRERGGEGALLHSAAELAVLRELEAARPDTDTILQAAEAASATPWERRHARGRRAIVEVVRARRRGRSEDEVAQLAGAARTELVGPGGRPTDYFTRATVLLLEHVASMRPPASSPPP